MSFQSNVFTMNFKVQEIFQVVLGLLLVCLAVIVFKIYSKRRHYMKILPGPPIRFNNPLGNAGEVLLYTHYVKILGKNAWFLQLLNAFNLLHRNDKLFCFWILNFPFVFITKAESVEETISGKKLTSKALVYRFLEPWLGTGLLTSNGTKWKSRRKLITPAFHFDILKEFMPVINEQSHVLIQRLREDTSKDYINIAEPISLCSLDIICETALGVSINAQGDSDSEYVNALNSIIVLIMERMTNYYDWLDFVYYRTEKGKQFKRYLKILHDFTRSVIKEKKEKLNSDNVSPASGKKRKAFLDLLLEHNMETKILTDEDVREEVDTFTAEGHETISTGVMWTLYLIGLYKDVQEKMISEIDSVFGNDTDRAVTFDDLKDLNYLDCVLKESHRLYPPAPIIAREVEKTTNICGCEIPEGSTCIIFSYILHRDEKYFPNPEKFDPDRFLPENSMDRHPFAYIPFSGGSRNCIGKSFALLEEKVIISTILRHFTLHSLDQRDKVIPTLNIVLRTLEPIRMQIRPRHLSQK